MTNKEKAAEANLDGNLRKASSSFEQLGSAPASLYFLPIWAGQPRENGSGRLSNTPQSPGNEGP